MRSTSSATWAAPGLGDGLERRQLATRRHVVRRPEDQPDPFVPQRGEVSVRLLHGDGVVRGDAREVEVLGGRVHEHDRQAQLQQPQVVVVRRVRLGVLAAREDHAGDLALQQHVDVLGLGHAARPRAQDGVEPALRERPADHLGERREDGVLQLGHHEPDHARAPHAQVGRALVADHVECSEHRRAGRVGDARLAVEHAADGRLADPGLLGYVCKISRHAATIRHAVARLATRRHAATRRARVVTSHSERWR